MIKQTDDYTLLAKDSDNWASHSQIKKTMTLGISSIAKMIRMQKKKKKVGEFEEGDAL